MSKSLVEVLVEAAVMAEREACAKLAESLAETLKKETKIRVSLNGSPWADNLTWDSHPFDTACNKIADSIRNREVELVQP